MTGIFNGLAATRTRLALLRAINNDPGRVYLDPEEHVVWDASLGMRVTERVREFIRHDWVRALTPDEPRGRGERKERGYYRTTAIGRQVLATERGQRA
jgi:hypothetical protein